MIEDYHTEFKERVSDTIARTAVAFSNTEGGTIYIGVNDKGEIIGVPDTDDASIRCSQILNDKIRPEIIMTSSIKTIKMDGKDIVLVEISEGDEKPYYLREKGLKAEGVYIRKGTTNIPVSEEAFKAMLQRPRSRMYENLPSLEQDLTFEFTESVFKKKQIALGKEQMKTLHMIDGGKYTNLAFMLSDQFDTPLKAALFQDDYRESFLDRAEFKGSILEQFDGVMRFISGHNSKMSIISGIDRIDMQAFPPEAVREAILNALIHRDYSMQGTILVNIYPDKMTISSPGGLNEIYSLEDLKTGISSTRNPKLADIFYRLGFVEAYGTGIPRIMKMYRRHSEPTIKVSDALFFITLPSMIHDENPIEKLLENNAYIKRSDLEDLGYDRGRAVREIDRLMKDGRIEKVGGGRSTKYRVVS